MSKKIQKGYLDTCTAKQDDPMPSRRKIQQGRREEEEGKGGTDPGYSAFSSTLLRELDDRVCVITEISDVKFNVVIPGTR